MRINITNRIACRIYRKCSFKCISFENITISSFSFMQSAHYPNCSALTTLRQQYHHLVVSYEGPKPLPKRALHIVRSRASSFKSEYPLLSLRLSCSFLRLLPRLPITSIPPPLIFSSITRCRRQFLRKM